MSTLREPILTIKKRLKNWLMYSASGSEIEDLALDLINRAKDWLCEYRQWDYLKKTQLLSLDANRTAALPSDLQTIIEVYADNNGDGKPDWWYYLDHPDVSQRYTLSGSYSPETGNALSITFPNNATLISPVSVRYSSGIDDYAGDDTALSILYSFFPPNLLLRCAQKIFNDERGRAGQDVANLTNSFWEDLKRFESMTQHSNQGLDLTVKNKYGMPIKIFGYALDGKDYRQSPTPFIPSNYFHGY